MDVVDVELVEDVELLEDDEELDEESGTVVVAIGIVVGMLDEVVVLASTIRWPKIFI